MQMLAGHSSLAITQRYIEGDGEGEGEGGGVCLSFVWLSALALILRHKNLVLRLYV